MFKGRTFLTLLTFSSVAIATSLRPVASSELQELDEQGNPINQWSHVVLTLNQDGDNLSFTFEETSVPPPCESPICPDMNEYHRVIQFNLVTVRPDYCGGIHYVAYAGEQSKERLDVWDHTKVTCDANLNADWEVTLSQYSQPKRYFEGNSAPIYTSHDCSKSAQMVCSMIEDSSVCSVAVDEGEISADGDNPCFAENNLNKLLCERGYNPDDFITRIQCREEPPPTDLPIE